MRILEEDLIVWIDCEMTGLELSKDHIIEIACIVTDKNLKILEEAPDIIINYPEEVITSMDDWCTEHHTQSGLVDAVRKSKISPEEADTIISEFIKKHFPNKGSAILAGNSVHVDKRFLEKDFPKTSEYFHYRIIDVSTVKELTRRWYPKVFTNLPSFPGLHRALDDIKDSINELKYYKENVFMKEFNSNDKKNFNNDITNNNNNYYNNNNYHNNNYNNSNTRNQTNRNDNFNRNNRGQVYNNSSDGSHFKGYSKSMNTNANPNPYMNETKNNFLKRKYNNNDYDNNNNMERKRIRKRKSCGAVVYKMEKDKPLFLIEHMVKGHTSIPKGHTEGRETEEETALREILEETNLKVNLDTGFRHTITYSPKKGIIKDVVFFIAEAKSGEMKNQESEVKGLEWLPFDQAIAAITFDSDKETLIKSMEYMKEKGIIKK